MAYLAGARGSQLVIKIRTSADGVTPKVWGGICSINAAREFALEVSTNESVGIDCDDPEKPGWVERAPDTLSGSVTGAGRMNVADWQDLWERATSGELQECQVVTNVTGGDIIQGFFLFTNLSKSGDRGAFVEFSTTLASSGPLTLEDLV
jgi:hypothetical protein